MNISSQNDRDPQNRVDYLQQLAAQRHRFNILPWLVLVFFLVTTLVAMQFSKQTIDREAKEYFQYRAEDATDRIVARLHLYEESLKGARALFDAEGQVNRAQFRNYVSGLQLKNDYPGIQGLGFSLIIPSISLAEHTRTIRAQGFPTYQVNPGGVRALYTSIIYLEPFDWRNQRAFGFDMYSESVRHQAMDAARDSGNAQISGKVVLVQETQKDIQAGFLMYFPVYRRNVPLDTVAQRRANIVGWVYEAFRMGDLMNGVFINRPDDLVLQIYDGASVRRDSLMLELNPVRTESELTRYWMVHSISLAGQDWTLHFSSTPALESRFEFYQPYGIAIIGLLVSVLFFGVTWLQINGRMRSASLALDLNQDLLTIRTQLQNENMKVYAILHNSSDGIYILDREGRLIEASESFCQMLGYAREEILGMNVIQWDIQWSDQETLRSTLAQQFASTARSLYDSKHRCRDGTIIDVEVSSFPFVLNGNPTLFNSSRDITNRRALEFSLQKERSLNASILKLAGPIILVIDTTGTIVSFNRTAEELTGYRFEEVKKEPYFFINFLPSEERSRVEAIFTAGVRSGSITPHVENYWLDVHGERRLVSWSNSMLTDEDNNVLSVIAVGIDITERRRAEDELISSEMRLKEILNASPISVRIAALRGQHILFFNKAYARLIQSSNPSEVDPGNYYSSPDEYKMIVDELLRGDAVLNRLIGLNICGDVVWVLASYMLIKYMNTEAVLGWFYDITALKNSENDLRVAATTFDSQEGMMVTDPDGNILKVNRAFSEITGYSLDDVIGKNPRILQSGRMEASFYDSMWQAIHTHGFWLGEIWNRRKNGEIFPEQLMITAVKDDEGQIVNYVGSIMDITEQKISETQIKQLAYYDYLTELPNRRLLQDRLQQDSKRTLRSQTSLALLCIDLDRFKNINDTFGHNKGDVLLIEATKRIQKRVRDTDTVARLGGDEFAIILPEYGELSCVERIVQNLVHDLAQPFDLGDGDVGHISGSVGIALYPHDTDDIDDLLKHADQAMYAAKHAGRNGFSYFTNNMQEEANKQMALTNDLHFALERGELEVYFQPIVDARNGMIVKAEALLRWHHPHRGLIAPGVFIPLAEESGLILTIGEWVFAEALRNIAQWKLSTGKLIQVSVNKSPSQFLRPEKHPWLDVYLASGLPDKCIAVEITESLLLSDSERVKLDFVNFRKNGIELSIDDFGTGFSALSYLNRFDVDYLKIDQAFIQKITTDQASCSLSEAIILMAHKLGIRVIAEGVESKAQSDLLKSFGCDYLQGFLYAKPVPSAEFEQLLVVNEILL